MFKTFRTSERGFALVLTLLFLPVFIGIGLLVVDIGRGNNAQADHQAAADALALAGARELDGKDGAILRAREAMEQLVNSVSFLGLSNEEGKISLSYDIEDPGPFTVIFLSAMPGDEGVDGDDDTLLTQGFVEQYAATDETAKYVYVYSQSQDLEPFFFNPVTRTRENVPVAAMAVATMKVVTCDLVPLFMCNPIGDKQDFIDYYNDGNFHGRLLKLSDIPGAANGKQSDMTPTPGNIGFLEIGDNSTGALKKALGGLPYNQCVEMQDEVAPKTGAVTNAWSGFNTRFDIYEDNGNPTVGTSLDNFSAGGPYEAAPNVRKGWAPSNKGACKPEPPDSIASIKSEADWTDFYTKYPIMSDNPTLDPELGNLLRAGDWNLLSPTAGQKFTIDFPDDKLGPIEIPPYWKTLYGSDPTPAQLAEMTSWEGKLPSRYDVYRYEQKTRQSGLLWSDQVSAGGAPYGAGEKGTRQCYGGTSAFSPAIDRRTMLVAVVDCVTYADELKGSSGTVPFDLLAKVFLVNPGNVGKGNRGTLDVEVVGISENLGDGNIDEFLKTEVFLVR